MSSVYQKALDYLTRREHSSTELRAKLVKAGQELDAVNEALLLLQQQGYQSDQRFSASLIRVRRGQGQGPQRIVAELEQHRIAAELWRDEMALYDDWLELANQVRCKKFGVMVPKTWPERAKQARFLAYRGFSPELIQSLWRQLARALTDEL